MTCIITYNEQEGIIEVHYSGTLVMQDLRGPIRDILKVAKETGCKLILTDTTQAEPELSILNYYQLVKFIAKEAQEIGVNIHTAKRAHIGRRGISELNFFENALVNRGQNMKLFTDAEEAKKWLKKEG